MEPSIDLTNYLNEKIPRRDENGSTIRVVPSIQVEDINHFNSGGCLSQVIVTYTQGGDHINQTLPLDVMVFSKCCSLKDIIHRTTMFPREIEMFDKVLPRMSTLLSIAFQRPQVIEALGPEGFKAPEVKNCFDTGHWLHEIKTISCNEDLYEFGRSWSERLCNRYETLFEDVHGVRRRDGRGINVLSHGDFRLHNVMFRNSESGEADAIMLVDFQCCSCHSDVLDLHQLIFSSAPEEVLVYHIDALLMDTTQTCHLP
ncbi:hypothetical protein PR048_018112 [Dryococelus australis]|uniref:CHK kinase-like domain-containing protein n=1 Tax=Dryococelus australis TaxID=614101 RepID=A0ABQ9HBD3_9NEOP|nr:hypothetical protein PR048_018112 [Dryococelus australis]